MRMSSRRIIVGGMPEWSALLIAAIAAITTLGCGGDGSDGTSKQDRDLSTVPRIGLPVFTGSLTKAQFIARSNEFCRESWADMLQEAARHRRERASKASEAELFAYSSRYSFLPHIQFWFDDISYLGAPKGEEEQVEDMLKALQWAVYSGEERRIASIELMTAVFSSFNRLAREYGLDECLVDRGAFRRVSP
jgi:hypothetical protein